MIKLIPEWRQSIRYYSQIANIATIAVSLVAVADLVMELLPIWRGVIEPETYVMLTAMTGTAALIGRVLKQGADND
jgi:hypothetical protein